MADNHLISSAVSSSLLSPFAVQNATSENTPYLIMDLNRVTHSYEVLRTSFPQADIYYAVKANPNPEVIRLLLQLGANFDVASPNEIDLCLALGALASQLSYGNTIKKVRDIIHASDRGVQTFTFDSLAELEKLATFAPGAKVVCRLLVTSEGASWPLSRKFGCSFDMAFDLLILAARWGLKPHGICFHVGSQQHDPRQWHKPLLQVRDLLRRLAAQGITLPIVNIGGGFPAHYTETILELEKYALPIHESLKCLAEFTPRIVLEPGRSLVADAGTLVSEVVLISHKHYHDDVRWVYLDIGKFGGLAETLDEAIRYRISTPHDGGETGPVILAGPTCDSADILYERTRYCLPLALEVGDHIKIHSTGAYTTSYASIGFNGFNPPATHILKAM